jgi:serine/threonine-protein kinase
MQGKPFYSPGDKIGGRFVVHQALKGGMGIVYLCIDERIPNLPYPYALKTFKENNPSVRELFETEVQTWIALERHQNIVKCEWMQDFDDIPFIVLEWITGDQSKGTDLRSWITPGQPLDQELALRFIIGICRGLRHAGEKVSGIVHRDLKPENILIDQNSDAKITDFGLATIAQKSNLQLSQSSGRTDLTYSMRVGNIVGTPLYMAPEQWHGDIQLDFRTDIYAVGCILFELLTGNRIFPGQTVNALKQQHLEAPIPEISGKFAKELNCILDACLAKKPENRFDNFEYLISDLNNIYQSRTGTLLPETTANELTAGDYGNRGITYHNLGYYPQAMHYFSEVIRIDPNNSRAYHNRG